jgi:hypothetical protein
MLVRTRPRSFAFAAAALLVATAGAQTTTRVSVATGGVQSNGASLGPGALAAGGRFVAFTSNASNLVAGDGNGHADAFVHDLQTGETTRASVASGGVEGNDASTQPWISGDGRYATYTSTATNLVPGDTNLRDDVFVRDLLAGTTSRVSVGPGGLQADSHSIAEAISADGRFVAFSSVATNLVPGDTNLANDVFVRDLQTGATVRVSVASGGAQSDGSSLVASISADGRYVAFSSGATNLVPGDTNGFFDAFVHDLQLSTTIRVSVDSLGAQGNSSSAVGSDRPSISGDGRFVAFTSAASNLVAGDTNGKNDVFVHDRVGGATTRVSLDSSGAQPNDHSARPAFSAAGRFVVFSSRATNLVGGDTNARDDVFVHDRVTAQTTRVSVGSGGAQSNGHSSPHLPPSISADGRAIAFDSGASNLVPGDTNANWDIFVHERPVAGPTAYCTAGTTASGCTASISASGEPDVAHSAACQITIQSVEGQRSGIVFYGLTALPQPWCAMGGTSFLCVKPPTQRTAAQSSGGTAGQCDGALALDWNAFQLASPSALGQPWSAGAKAYVQGWFRDPSSCKTTSLSDALELTYQP